MWNASRELIIVVDGADERERERGKTSSKNRTREKEICRTHFFLSAVDVLIVSVDIELGIKHDNSGSGVSFCVLAVLRRLVLSRSEWVT